jgi:hypothetical protein
MKSFPSPLLNNGGIFLIAPFLCTGGEHTKELLPSTEVNVNEDDDEHVEGSAAAAFALATFFVFGFATVGTFTMLKDLIMLVEVTYQLAVIAVIAVVSSFRIVV